MTNPQSIIKITFLPARREVEVPAGTIISRAAAQVGVNIDVPCAGRGTCGKCRVHVLSGEVPPPEHDGRVRRRRLSERDIVENWRLACLAEARSDLLVHVPQESMQVALSAISSQVAPRPFVHKLFAELTEPSLDDQRPDFGRLKDAVGLPGLRAAPATLAALPKTLRSGDWAVTAVVAGDLCLAVEPGDTRETCFGVAFDVGTTTVVARLVDLVGGWDVAVASGLNEQTMYGADVISRIQHAMAGPAAVAQLQTRVLGSMNRLLVELCRKAEVRPEEIYEATVVGNSTMHHLLLGLDPTHLSMTPFPLVLSEPLAVPARDLRLQLHPNGLVYFPPLMAAYVGSDTLGVILATGLHRSERIKLAIDVGTNGEVVLGNRDRFLATAAPAGPAFEGASIRFGMRGATGAIQHVTILEDVEIDVIGGVAPTGICGSGLIDAAAELRKRGIVDERGRLLTRQQIEGKGLSRLAARLVEEPDGGRAFRLTDGEEPIVLSQRDIRELQLAKGAIFAAIQMLKRLAGVEDDRIDEILLAGAFGSYIRPESAVIIGLIPPLPLARIQSVGNAASEGAYLMLVSVDQRAEAEQVAGRVEHVELSAVEAFQEVFIDALRFPQLGPHPRPSADGHPPSPPAGGEGVKAQQAGASFPPSLQGRGRGG